VLRMSLKPASGPLMDSGKAMARSGELLIELTSALDTYGGALSAAGAQIRNAGDHVAQAAASCRFKTGLEIVIDELREAATCFDEVKSKFELADEEAKVDKLIDLSKALSTCVRFSRLDFALSCVILYRATEPSSFDYLSHRCHVLIYFVCLTYVIMQD